MRSDGRSNQGLRKISIKKDYLKYAEGSCLIEAGNTKVICSASVEDGVPPFLRDTGSGWVTAEYGMLPRSCKGRIMREAARGKVGGRTHEIQRLIGRSLRAIVDMSGFGERTIRLDCDVVQADGGTRAASITGAFVALAEALNNMKKEGTIEALPLHDYVASVSVGAIDESLMLDLDYGEDSKADVDMNIVMTGKGEFVEIQGTAEGNPFTKKDMDNMLSLAKKGIESLIKKQREVLKIDI